jgi:hypothetical protein
MHDHATPLVCVIIVLILAVVLEYVIRHATMRGRDKCRWDKWDWLTLGIAFIILLLAIVMHCTRRHEHFRLFTLLAKSPDENVFRLYTVTPPLSPPALPVNPEFSSDMLRSPQLAPSNLSVFGNSPGFTTSSVGTPLVITSPNTPITPLSPPLSAPLSPLSTPPTLPATA